MAALAPSRSAAPPVRRRPTAVGRGGRDRLGAEWPERLPFPDDGGRLRSPPVGPAFPAVAPSSTAPAVALPLARGATAGRDPHAEVGPADCTLRLAGCPARRFPLHGLAFALLLHGAVMAALPRAALAPLDGGAPEDVTMVEMIDPTATDTVDRFAGAQSASDAADRADTPEPSPDAPTAAVADTAATEVPAAVPTEMPVAAEPVPVPAVEATPAETAAAIVTAPPAETVPPPPPPPRAPREIAESAAPRADTPPHRDVKAGRTERNTAPRRTASRPGSAAVDSRAGGTAGRAEAAAVGAGEVASWRATVLAALARAKRYPEDARAQGRTGRVAITFTIGRDGRVVAVALASSSGVGSLDGATLDMPHRATFPPMPAAAGAAQTFTAGVRYDLR